MRTKLSRAVVVIAVLYVLVIQVPLFSPYRYVPADEIQLVDAAYALASGATRVPASLSWSHIIPELSYSFPAYTPLYLYLLAGMLKLFGLTVTTIGALHVVLRLLATLVFFLLSYTVTRSKWASAALSAVWATFVYGPTGRYEDLALVFLLLSAYILLRDEHYSRRSLVASGAFLGLGFLTYASSGVSGALIIVSALIARHGLRPLISTTWLRNALWLFGTAGAVAATWLFWIIPYWPEFRVHFLEFALPDAAAPNYWDSISSLFRYVTGGIYTSPIPLHYTLIPIILLLSFVVYAGARWDQRPEGTWAALFVPIVIALLSARLRIHKTYNLVWLMSSFLVLLPLFLKPLLDHHFALRRRHLFLPSLLVLVIVLQLAGTGLLQSLQVLGDIARVAACGPAPHRAVIASIPPGNKVLTNSGYVFYEIREQNPIYWPAGLQGQTPGGIPYKSSYDSSFRWLVLTNDFLEQEHDVDTVLLERGNPGVKFSWDGDSYDYFRRTYSLIAASTLNHCNANSGLRRFSRMTDAVYLYEMLEPTVDKVAP